jgi:hypothetical protein
VSTKGKRKEGELSPSASTPIRLFELEDHGGLDSPQDQGMLTDRALLRMGAVSIVLGNLADKGFTAVEWERHWLEDYEALVAATPKNNSRRAWSKADRRWASGKRQIIEGVICQLKDFYGLERHRAKTLGGLLTRLAAKIAAYPLGQRINNSLGRPLRHLADLLV